MNPKLLRTKLVMTVVALLSFLPASAYDFKANGLYFNITDATKHEVEVTSKVRYEASYSGNISIPSTVTNGGTTYSVTAIGEHAFWSCEGLTSVTIPNSVTSIEDYAFTGCWGLTSITIPNSVTAIGRSAFSNCKGLTSVTIPNSVIAIGTGAFSGCSDLIEINVDPANSFYASVDGVLFTKDLTRILLYPMGRAGTFSIPNSVTAIGDMAFYLCRRLTSITIPNSVTSIGNQAFCYCYSLTNMTIPNSVTAIGDEAFSYCTSLTSITIPNSVSAIGNQAFWNCDDLIEINVDPGNSFYASIGGVLYNKPLTEIIQYPCGKTGTTFSIPNSVTSIVERAFDSCSGLTSINIPSSVTSIGMQAFSYCTGLTSITIPNSVTSIGHLAFYYCKGLVEINVDPGNSFYASVDGVLYNKNLTEIIQYPCGKSGTTFSIPNSVTSIGGSAFSHCSGLTSITIPNSVTFIGDWAFSSCSSLTSVTIPSSVTYIGYSAFDGCPLIKSVYCHWDKPFICEGNLFSFSCYEEGTLYVPKGCADKYRSTSPWSNFKMIVEDESLGIENIMENQPTGGYIVYDLKGVLRLKTADMDEVKRLPAGLYIVNGRKVLIR